ncbi:uncharacterized protein V1510DRAFT_437916 [Dipodascopsis tothii]|uniref:uncharacterized protein n=1 Tax=Dipodascopsis tothii TaxID=44089 RepID=UPI0034CF8678
MSGPYRPMAPGQIPVQQTGMGFQQPYPGGVPYTGAGALGQGMQPQATGMPGGGMPGGMGGGGGSMMPQATGSFGAGPQANAGGFGGYGGAGAVGAGYGYGGSAGAGPGGPQTAMATGAVPSQAPMATGMGALAGTGPGYAGPQAPAYTGAVGAYGARAPMGPGSGFGAQAPMATGYLGSQPTGALAAQPTGVPGQWGFVNAPATGLPGIEALQARLMPQTGASGSQSGSLEGNAKIPWAVTKDEKTIYDKIFNAWDGLNKGFLAGATCVELLGQSGLPREDLERIWTLSDPGNRGKLNKDEFAVAMHLVYRKLNGYEVPARLPPELVPPSSRNISDSISQVKSYLRSDADARRGSGAALQPQQTGVSYLKARSFRSGGAAVAGGRKDATMYKNNDDEITTYVSSARHRSARTPSRTSSASSTRSSPTTKSKAETLEDLRKAVREKQIMLDAIDVEDEQAHDKDSYLERRDRDEADDLMRKIRRLQDELDRDPQSALRSIDDGAERRDLRRQLQYMLDRLPTLVSTVRATCTKIADAKLELFRLRDAKAHPGQRLVGTGPGGAVTESDRRKAKSMAILQARMAALTGKPAPADTGDDDAAGDARLADETSRVRSEKDNSERMIRDVDESVNQLRESLEQMLRDDDVDVQKDREWRRWEEGVGVDDEVREFIYDLQRKSRLATATAAREPEPRRPAVSFSAPATSSAPMASPVASSSPVPRAPAGETASERSARIKAEAERRMNERLAALGISRPAKGASPTASPRTPATVSAFEPPMPAAEQTPTPPPAAPVAQPVAPVAQPAAQPWAAPVAQPVAEPVAQPPTPYVAQPVAPAAQSAPPPPPPPPVAQPASPAVQTPTPPSASPFAPPEPVQPEPLAPVAQPAMLAPAAAASPDQSEQFMTPAASPYHSQSGTPAAPQHNSNNPFQIGAAAQFVPPAASPVARTPSASTAASTPMGAADKAFLDEQRRRQRGYGDDDDDWSVVPSEDEDDEAHFSNANSSLGPGMASEAGNKPSTLRKVQTVDKSQVATTGRVL